MDPVGQDSPVGSHPTGQSCRTEMSCGMKSYRIPPLNNVLHILQWITLGCELPKNTATGQPMNTRTDIARLAAYLSVISFFVSNIMDVYWIQQKSRHG